MHGGENRLELEREAIGRDLDNVAFYPFVEREWVPYVYGSADLCLVTLRSGAGDDIVPSKIQTILACGRPVVAAVDEDSATAALVRRSGAGSVARPDEPEELAGAIRELLADTRRCTQCSEQARAWAESYLSARQAVRRYETIFRSLAQGS